MVSHESPKFSFRTRFTQLELSNTNEIQVGLSCKRTDAAEVRGEPNDTVGELVVGWVRRALSITCRSCGSMHEPVANRCLASLM